MDTQTRQGRRARAVFSLLCLLGLLALTDPATAQRFFLPIDLGDGVLLTDDSPKPYEAAFRIHTLFGQRVRLGPSLGVAFANPDVSLQAGGRLQIRLYTLRIEDVFRVAEVDLAAEALWGTEDRNPIGGALRVGINRVIQFTFRAGYDVDQESAYIGTAVGTDLTFFFGSASPSPPPPPLPSSFEGCYRQIDNEARTLALVDFRGNEDLLRRTAAFLKDGARVRRFLDSPSINAARGFLVESDLQPLARHIDASLDEVRDRDACRSQVLDTKATLDAFRAAWDRAVALSEN